METKIVAFTVNLLKLKLIYFLNLTLWISLIFDSICFRNFAYADVYLIILIVTTLFLAFNLSYIFSKKTTITLSGRGFLFETEKKETTIREEILFSEISAYKIRLDARRPNSEIKIYTSDGECKKYFFITKKDEDDQISTKQLIQTLHLHIQKYNLDKPEDKKIEFRPQFSGTKPALYMIYFFGLAYLIAVLTLLTLSAKGYEIKYSLQIYFYGPVPFLGLLIGRGADINFYKAMIKYAQKEL